MRYVNIIILRSLAIIRCLALRECLYRCCRCCDSPTGTSALASTRIAASRFTSWAIVSTEVSPLQAGHSCRIRVSRGNSMATRLGISWVGRPGNIYDLAGITNTAMHPEQSSMLMLDHKNIEYFQPYNHLGIWLITSALARLRTPSRNRLQSGEKILFAN
jgi:hypothetical protein